MSTTIAVRTLTIPIARELAPGIAALLGELGYPSDPASIDGRVQRLLASRDNHLLVATADDAPHGVGGLLSLHLMPVIHHDEQLAMIVALVVTEALRGAGVGRALIERAEAIARDARCDRLMVTTHLRRAGAHAFYERLGFEFTGRRYVKAL